MITIEKVLQYNAMFWGIVMFFVAIVVLINLPIFMKMVKFWGQLKESYAYHEEFSKKWKEDYPIDPVD